nr:CheR family methyltransferase [uncultured Lutibacter sp.]
MGASAGGLESLSLFFKNMPNATGMAFVVIQHLDPNYVGMMPELLQRTTNMMVLQVKDNLLVKPNTIYVIPPNKSMSILKGVLHLFAPIESRGLRLPIDIFFRSLALDKQHKSIGIILSGMGSDGSLGLKAIKEHSGVVLVQDPIDAKFNGMPISAIKAVVADIVAPVKELPLKLIELIKLYPKASASEKIAHKTSNNIDKVIIILREQLGHDFALYKKNTLFRRIERRKGVHKIDKIENYVRFLQDNPSEVEILFKELLIGVTNFFRDIAVWELLKEKVLPALINKLPNGYVLRAWVVGCSTGEEAYSLAIIFDEVMQHVKKSKKISLQIFATDIDIVAVEKARKGIFLKNIINDVSPERITKYFTETDEGYRVNTHIREMIVFAPQNIIKDAPFTRLDIITCRNVLIYMETELQKKIIDLFSYSLNIGGIMVLGTSETQGSSRDAFNEIDLRNKIFKRKKTNKKIDLLDFPSSFYHKKTKTMLQNKPTQVIEDIQILANQVLLQRFAPASILVNEKGDILYITGHTGDFLEPAAGKANWNIYAMARAGLSEELPNAIFRALQNVDTVQLNNLKIGNGKNVCFVDVTIQRLDTPEALKGNIMLIFSNVKSEDENVLLVSKNKKPASTGRIKGLEFELKQKTEDLQHMGEQMQTSQEELKSTNEELQSTNEELQSTNEELTTSKEEMQSLNEELQTVNMELQSKVYDFERINADMKNLLNSTEIATIFLDKDLNIRSFTDSVTKIFKIRKVDIGRPLTELVSVLEYTNFEHDTNQVLKTLNTVETNIETNDNRWFAVRIMPYRTLDDRIDGLVITFNNISDSKQLEIELMKANDILEKNKLKE